MKVELALPLINDTLYDCPDAAANSSESWEEKVSTPDSSVEDLWHFGVDPDPDVDLRIHASD